MPIVAPTDADAYACALRACGPMEPGAERIARLRDTLHLGEVYVSAAVRDELRARPDVEIAGEFEEMFDQEGALRAIVWSPGLQPPGPFAGEPQA